MTVFAGPFAVLTCLLAIAGVAKVADPAPTAGALRALHLPSRRWYVRIGGGAEALLAVAALVTGRPVLAVAVGTSYLAFAGFVIAARRAGTPISSCGCLGKLDTPPRPVHVGLNLLAAFAAFGFAARGGAALVEVLGDQPLGGVPFVLLVAVGVAAATLAMSALPRTLTAAHGGIR